MKSYPATEMKYSLAQLLEKEYDLEEQSPRLLKRDRTHRQRIAFNDEEGQKKLRRERGRTDKQKFVHYRIVPEAA